MIMTIDNIAVMMSEKIIKQEIYSKLLKHDDLYIAIMCAQDLDIKIEASKFHEKLKKKKNVKKAFNQSFTLQWTQFKILSKNSKHEVKHLSAETVEYSLEKCIWIMLKEHSDLYLWYLIIIFKCLIDDDTYSTQAIIFFHLINIFTLQNLKAKDQINFYAFMFFMLMIANLFKYFSIEWVCNTINQTIIHCIHQKMIEHMIYFDQNFFDHLKNFSKFMIFKLSFVSTSLQKLIFQNLDFILNVLINILFSNAFNIAFNWKLNLIIVFDEFSLLIIVEYIHIQIDQKLETSTEKWFANNVDLIIKVVISIRIISFLTLKTLILREYNEILRNIVIKMISSLVMMFILYALS